MPESSSRSGSGSQRSRSTGGRPGRSVRRSRSSRSPAGGGGVCSNGGGGFAGYRNRYRFKQKERNFPAAVFSMIVIVVLCTALVEPNWITLSGGGCSETHIGVYQFFFPGYFLNSDKQQSVVVYKYGPNPNEVLKNCVTHKTVWLMKSIIAFCFLAIGCSVTAFFLDLLGPTQRVLKVIHRNAIPSIVTVIICVLINGLCYLLTLEVKDLQKLTKLYSGSKVSVTFDVSFYLIATAGGLAVFATACNCLRRYPVREDPAPEPLLDDYDELEVMLQPGPEISSLTHMPPPPAYTP